jgi:hypothetical protein
MGMKMAKASEADLEMAMKLVNALDVLRDGYFPQELRPDDDEQFDEDDFQECKEVIRHLLSLARGASLMRVVFGAAVMLDPANKLVDPDAATLEHHPETEQAKQDATTYRGLLLWALYHHQGGSSHVGQPIRKALGIGEYDRLTDAQIQEAKAAAAFPAKPVADLVDRETITWHDANTKPGPETSVLCCREDDFISCYWDDEDKWWLSSETDRIINGVLYWADPSGPQK